MDRYDGLREELAQVLDNVSRILARMEDYEALPIPSKQLGLDLEISSFEIHLQNLTPELRKRLL
jgi:hypothetical protein